MSPAIPLSLVSKVICSQIHTIPEENIIEYNSQLSEEKLKDVYVKVYLYGIGMEARI